MFLNFLQSARVKRNTLWEFFYVYTSNALSSGLGLITVLMLGNFLDPHEYGNYKYIYSIVGVLGILSLTGGVRNTIIQSAAKGYDGILLVLYRKNFLLNLPMIAGGMFVGLYYISQNNLLIGLTVPILTIVTVIANNGILTSAYFNGRSLHKKLLIFQSCIGVASIASLLLTIKYSLGVGAIIICSSLAIACVSSLGLLYTVKYLIRSKDIHESIARYGKHLNILNVMSTVMQHIDSVLIFSFIGSTNLALYAIATPFVDRLLGFIKASYLVVLPKFTRYGPKTAHNHLYTRMVISLTIGLIIWGIYSLSAPFIFQILFPLYIDSVPLTILFALNIPLAAVTIIPQAYIDSLIEIKNKYIINTTLFIVRIISLPIGMYLYGVEGVIYSELLTRIVGIVVLIVIVHQSQRQIFSEA